MASLRSLLGLITQRPGELSKTALSQCSNYITLRMFHPDDLNIIKGINNKLDNNIYLNFSNEFVWPDNADKSLDIEGTCYALTDHIAILSDGTITACCLDASGKINFGNIFDVDIQDVLNNKLFNEMLDGFKEGKRIHPVCKKCNFLETKIKN